MHRATSDEYGGCCTYIILCFTKSVSFKMYQDWFHSFPSLTRYHQFIIQNSQLSIQFHSNLDIKIFTFLILFLLFYIYPKEEEQILHFYFKFLVGSYISPRESFREQYFNTQLSAQIIHSDPEQKCQSIFE